MEKVPARFKRVAEAFDEAAAKARRLCESSGDHSPQETAVDLSDLVKSFMERRESGELGDFNEVGEEREGNGWESEGNCSDSELRDELRGLLGYRDDEVKRNLRDEIEKAYGVVGNGSSPDFKHRLVTRLRERGFDAGICKSTWDRIGRFPSGSYEYMDVTKSGTRYVIEFSLCNEFQIARATDAYASLLQLFPPIFVGKMEELKRVVRLMCNAIKISMKSVDMHVPPWRRFGYMQVRWFGSDFERVETGLDSGSDSGRKRSESGSRPILYHCREDFASKVGMKTGQLAVAFDGANMLL